MILFENSVVKLEYSPATDILEIAYPDLHNYLLPEIKHSINILVDTVISYDVKKLLLDSTRTIISVSAEESSEIALYLAGGLVRTRVQKVARLESPNAAVEETAQNNIRQIKDAQQLPFELQNFTSRTQALAWLNTHEA
jgi:hypothetical protein